MTNPIRICLAIPARRDSVRFPDKILLDLDGKSLIERVWAKCQEIKSLVDEIVVLVDDEYVLEVVKSFGGIAVLTPKNLQNGTERIAYYAKTNSFDYFVNCQGDDPTIDSNLLARVVEEIRAYRHSLLTVVSRTADSNLWDSASVVKVVLGLDEKTLYFSRYPVPYYRDLQTVTKSNEKASQNLTKFIHTGIYAYHEHVLERYLENGPTFLEEAEKLEQLRFIDMGEKFSVIEDDFIGTPIDIPGDEIRALQKLREFKSCIH